jgi:hypothetical protein
MPRPVLLSIPALTLFAVAALPFTEWKIDNLDSIAGTPVTIYGEPQVVTEGGLAAVRFDGVNDGIHLAADPLSGATTFTLELYFRPASGGGFEQRWCHVQEQTTQDRMLLELRSTAEGWYLDTFVLRDGVSLALIDENLKHPSDRWYHVAAVYDGTTLMSYVDGVKELESDIQLRALNDPTVSLGTRQDRRSWFKGEIAWLKSTPRALSTDEFTTPGMINKSAAGAAWNEISVAIFKESDRRLSPSIIAATE